MRPINLEIENSQGQLFQNRLENMINMNHPLVKAEGEIDWHHFDSVIGGYFCEGRGRPALPVRLMAGLHYLKYTFDLSDEDAVLQFCENPYWQYFCGYEYFQIDPPCEASSMVRWRKVFGQEGCELLLKQTIEAAKNTGQLSEKDFDKVSVDTTVQEKAIAFPTDARLFHKMRRKLVKAAKSLGIELRQSYERVGQEAMRAQSKYASAQQFKRAARETRRLRIYMGRVMRDVERKARQKNIESAKLNELLEKAKKLFSQKKDSKNKIYSIHCPEVECIAKGKIHKKYEFGCKVSFVTGSRSNLIFGAQALHDNPFDGHTLKGAIDQMQELTGHRPKDVYVDKGYRGKENHPEDVFVHLPGGKRKKSRSEKRWMKRRNAIEPIIGHSKSDHRMDRNFLLGKEGDQINALLSACGFNLKKLLRAFLCHFSMAALRTGLPIILKKLQQAITEVLQLHLAQTKLA